MKNKNFRFTIPVALAAALFLSTGPILANTNAGAGHASASRQTQASSQNAPTARQTKTKGQAYEGTIVVGQNGICKLKVGKYEYKLTDQAEASRYANRKVIVTGVYQRNSGTIRVQKIKPA